MAFSLSAVYGARDYMRRALDPKYPGILLLEHWEIINTLIIGTSDHFLFPKNKKKNRCSDYPSWDFSRVVLKSHHGSNYIDASYVSGFDFGSKFIATQEPMTNTFDDFWSMVWQENSRVIVMLNGTKKKSKDTSLQYFPSNQDKIKLREFIIKKEHITKEPGYIITTLTVVHKQTGESRRIHHFKYLDWPEADVPHLNLFLDFLLAVNRQDQRYLMEAMKTNQPLPGPIVVHCDIGIGRTAAFCAIDICLYQLVHTGYVSVASTVITVRQQRRFSVQSLSHYIFINNVVYYFLNAIQSNACLYLELRSHLTSKDIRMLVDYD